VSEGGVLEHDRPVSGSIDTDTSTGVTEI